MRMSHADTIRDLVTQYVPNGFRDEYGVAHEGPHQRDALAALDALAAENQRLRAALFIIANHSASEDSIRVARAALDGSDA